MNPDGTIHATCIAIGGRGVLLTGRSGSGKSDLALRLIDRGARLVSDDYTVLRVADGRLIASAPARLAGKMEVRGVGIVDETALAQAEVALVVELDGEVERMPVARSVMLAGLPVPAVALTPFEVSAPLKVERALRHLPGTGRGTARAASGGGVFATSAPPAAYPSTTSFAGGPPPRAGEVLE